MNENLLLENKLDEIIINKKLDFKQGLITNENIHFLKGFDMLLELILKKSKNDKDFDRYIDQTLPTFKKKTSLSTFKYILKWFITLSTADNVVKLFENNKIQTTLYLLSNNINTIRASCTYINNIVKNCFDIMTIKLNKLEVYIKLEDAIEWKKEQEKITDLKNITTINIYETDIKKIYEYLKSSNHRTDKILLCLLLTGCRVIEILHLAEFQKVKYNTNSILQIGTSKNLEDKKDNKDKTHIIKPILFNHNVEDLLEKIKDVRSTIYTNDRVEITNRFSKRLNQKLKKIFTELKINYPVEKVVNHLLRKIYVNYCYMLYGRYTQRSPLNYYKQLLGHHSYRSLKNYTTIKIIPEED